MVQFDYRRASTACGLGPTRRCVVGWSTFVIKASFELVHAEGARVGAGAGGMHQSCSVETSSSRLGPKLKMSSISSLSAASGLSRDPIQFSTLHGTRQFDYDVARKIITFMTLPRFRHCFIKRCDHCLPQNISLCPHVCRNSTIQAVHSDMCVPGIFKKT